ncbi:hypothetical protein CCP2SC5_820005 [Azospirillaceae bacterium]
MVTTKQAPTKDPAMYRQLTFDRMDNDAYYTPDWCTEALLSRVKFRGAIWEPAAGLGRMSAVLRAGGYDVIESDIDPRVANVVNFLDCRAMMGGSISIVTNPPYHIGENFVAHALSLALSAEIGGMVAMLLRHEFDCAKKRRLLFERPEFALKLTLTSRPRWMQNTGNSPRHNFAWYIWDAHHSGAPCLGWLP